jgi:hypothetical protein
MDSNDTNASSQSAPKGTQSFWLLLLCSAAGAVAAITMSAGLLARQSPMGLVAGAGLAIFPLLPLAWHAMAEAGTKNRAEALITGRSRFALRTLAVALVVLGVSLGDLGPKQAYRNLRDLGGQVWGKAAGRPKPAPVPVPAVASSHGLESFIPADATLVVGLAGSAAVQQLLAAYGVDTQEKLAALATCKIDLTNARVLLAARGRDTQMIVLRAPGITDEGNLYCLVGVMGPNRLQIRSDAKGVGKTLEVSGFLSRPLTFRLLDQATAIATDETWRETADQKLLAADGASARGPLAQPLLRVDRAAPLWLASVDETPEGTWDLALDSRQDGSDLRLQGSATPPSGQGDQATISVRVPLAFTRALPESAVALGIRGVLAAVVAASAGQSPAKVLALPPPPASPPKSKP